MRGTCRRCHAHGLASADVEQQLVHDTFIDQALFHHEDCHCELRAEDANEAFGASCFVEQVNLCEVPSNNVHRQVALQCFGQLVQQG